MNKRPNLRIHRDSKGMRLKLKSLKESIQLNSHSLDKEVFEHPSTVRILQCFPSHIVVKISKTQRKVKCVSHYKGKHIRIAWSDIFQALGVNNCQSRLLYSANLSFQVVGEIKTFQTGKN